MLRWARSHELQCDFFERNPPAKVIAAVRVASVRWRSYLLVPTTPQSKVQAKIWQETGEKHGAILAKQIRRIRPSISIEYVGRTSQLSGIAADFSSGRDGFYDGFSAQRDGFCDGFCGGFFVLCFPMAKRRIL